MRILLAPDSFGGTLSALEAAAAVREGWLRRAPEDVIISRPLSDGGPGFLDVLLAGASGTDGRLIPVRTRDPLGRETDGAVLLVGGTAYVESAQATGLHLLRPEEKDPKVTTSYGVGVLITAAVEAGARTVVIGLGGSATNDGGAGMLAALGVIPRAANDAPLPYGGAALAAVERADGVPQLRGVSLIAATDVDSPLLGLRGASAVFGPQKGATDNDVQLLDAALGRWAQVLERDVEGALMGLADLPGSGAAGGIGAALFALGGTRASGIDLVRAAVGLDEEMAKVDLAITGEGKFDWQSLQGKVAVGVAAAATEHGVPCIVLAGQVAAGQRETAAAGIERAYSVAERAGSVDAALAEPARRLGELAEHVAGQWHTGC